VRPLSDAWEKSQPLKVLSSSRWIASDRDGFGSGWRSIQASSLASSSGGISDSAHRVAASGAAAADLFGLFAIETSSSIHRCDGALMLRDLIGRGVYPKGGLSESEGALHRLQQSLP
jgi:hypothetical protein